LKRITFPIRKTARTQVIKCFSIEHLQNIKATCNLLRIHSQMYYREIASTNKKLKLVLECKQIHRQIKLKKVVIYNHYLFIINSVTLFQDITNY